MNFKKWKIYFKEINNLQIFLSARLHSPRQMSTGKLPCDWLLARPTDHWQLETGNWLAALMNTVLTYLSTTSLVSMTSRLKKTGLPNSWSTALSISGCLRMKFNTESGSVAVSLWQVPGRGSGTLEFSTGSQALFEVACSLNLPVDG